MDPPPLRDTIGVRALQDDPGLRFDLLDALLTRLVAEVEGGVGVGVGAGVRARVEVGGEGPPGCHIWLTRPKDPALHDVDVAWSATAHHVLAAHGLAVLGCYAVTRAGWLDVRTGEHWWWPGGG